MCTGVALEFAYYRLAVGQVGFLYPFQSNLTHAKDLVEIQIQMQVG